MNSRATRRFWQLYRELPARIREAADKQFALWRENPRHRIEGQRPVNMPAQGIALGSRSTNDQSPVRAAP